VLFCWFCFLPGGGRLCSRSLPAASAGVRAEGLFGKEEYRDEVTRASGSPLPKESPASLCLAALLGVNLDLGANWFHLLNCQKTNLILKVSEKKKSEN